MQLDQHLLNTPTRRFVLEGIDATFIAHHTNETWNGFDCPVFSKEQVEAFLSVLNGDADFEAELIDDVAVINIFSSGESIRIESENGAYRFNGWCFIVTLDL